MRVPPLLHVIRHALLQRHAYFSCCASCGDIARPLGHRLCASLSPKFPVDALHLPDVDDDACDETPDKITTHLPWLRRCIRITPEDAALAHQMQDLAEQYLIILDSRCLCGSFSCLDFFTPNGIPLVFIEKGFAPEGCIGICGDYGIWALTRDNAAAFAKRCEDQPRSCGSTSQYLRALAAWSYANARAIPGLWPQNGTTHER